MSEEEVRALHRRARFMTYLLAVAIVGLLARLGYLQVVQYDAWLAAAEGQRVRRVEILAPRGDVVDRHGVPLATTRPAFVARLVYTREPPDDEEVRLLAGILEGVDEAFIRHAIEGQRRGRAYEPVTLKVDLNEREHVLLETHKEELPGVIVDVVPIRSYPFGASGAHVLGYVSKGVNAADIIGGYGLERTYNGNPASGSMGLQGVNGFRQVEVDPQGRPVDLWGEVPPEPGHGLRLTLDAGLQRVADEALAARMEELRITPSPDCPDGCPAGSGAAVVIQVDTGEVLALASQPSFDLNLFALATFAEAGSSGAAAFDRFWMELSQDPGRPLLNHATMDAAPPGSTFKPFTALAALESSRVTPEERISCPGYYEVPGLSPRLDWKPGGHGIVNLTQALARSCNVYFYELGHRLDIDDLVSTAHAFGLGELSGIGRDLGVEVPGLVAGPEAKASRTPGEPWYWTENLSAAIGQSYNQFTPIQMAVAAAALANGGTVYQPYVVAEEVSPEGEIVQRAAPQVRRRLDVDPANLDAVRAGMLAVVSCNSGWSGVDSPCGTGYGAFADFPRRSRELTGREVRIAGKTGTAEAGRRGDASHAWFIAYAPYDAPEVAIAVLIRNGGGGSAGAAPVARRILDHYFGLDRMPEDIEPAPRAGQPIYR